MTLAAGLCHAGSGQLDMTSLTTSTALAVLRQAAADQRAGIPHIPRDRVLAGAMALDQLTPLATRWLGGLILARARCRHAVAARRTCRPACRTRISSRSRLTCWRWCWSMAQTRVRSFRLDPADADRYPPLNSCFHPHPPGF